jgi:hypothetical protein
MELFVIFFGQIPLMMERMALVLLQEALDIVGDKISAPNFCIRII